jgi:8-oxo-dGTP diphosphatase
MIKALLISVITTLCTMGPLRAQEVFQEMPQNFHPKIEVAGCFIRNGDETLFLKRLADKPQGNTWAIPAGKSDKGETAEQTVIREIREETGIEMQKQCLAYLGTVYIRHSTGDFVFHAFEYNIADSPQIKFNPKEHVDYRWVTLREALEEMSLIPGEDELIKLAYGVQPTPPSSYSYHRINYMG